MYLHPRYPLTFSAIHQGRKYPLLSAKCPMLSFFFLAIQGIKQFRVFSNLSRQGNYFIGYFLIQHRVFLYFSLNFDVLHPIFRQHRVFFTFSIQGTCYIGHFLSRFFQIYLFFGQHRVIAGIPNIDHVLYRAHFNKFCSQMYFICQHRVFSAYPILTMCYIGHF